MHARLIPDRRGSVAIDRRKHGRGGRRAVDRRGIRWFFESHCSYAARLRELKDEILRRA